MAINTYATLQSSIGNWLNREDLDAVIPDFIALFEADFERKTRIREMLVEDDLTLDGLGPRVDLPADFLELKAIQFNSATPSVPDYVTSNWMRHYRKSNPAGAGVPRFYTIEGGRLQFEVTPPSDLELEVVYYQKLPRLSDVQTDNWLLLAHPDIYLYGSLMHTAPFLKDDERVALWGSLYQGALADLKKQDNRGQANAAPVQIRSRRALP